MANPSNHGSAVIRLACDPKFFPNSDGSETVRVTGYAENDFANKAGEVTSEKLSFERYLPNGKRGAFGHMHTGDLVGFGYRLATSDYTNAQGERVYGQGNLAIINSVKLYSSKRESDTRAAEQQQSAKPQESQAKQTEQQQQNQAPQQQQRPQEAQSAPQAQPQQQTSSQPQPNVPQQAQPQQSQVPQQQQQAQPQMPQQGLQPVNPAIAQQIITQQQHNPNAPININQIARDLGQQPPMSPQQAQQQPPQVQQQPQQQQGQPQQQTPAGPIGYPGIFSPKPPAAPLTTPQQAQPQVPAQQQPQQPNLPPQIPQQAPQPQQQPQNQPGTNELPYGMGGVSQNPSMAARQEYNSTYSETLNANRASSPKGGFSADHDDIPF